MKAVYWSVLRSPDFLRDIGEHEAIAGYVDECEESKLPETIKIYGFAQVQVNRRLITEWLLDTAIDRLDEEYGIHGRKLQINVTSEMLDASQALLDAILKGYTPRQWEIAETKVINLKEWLIENKQ